MAEQQMFRCNQPGCEAEYKTKSHLGIHKRFKHGIMGQKHVVKHSSKKSFQCPECPRSFSESRFLGNHMKAHERHRNKTAIVVVKPRKGLEKVSEYVIPEEIVSYIFGKVEAIIENYCINAQFSKPELTARVSDHLRATTGRI